MLIAAAKRACGVRYVRTYTSHNLLSRVHAAYHVPVPTVHSLSDCVLRIVLALMSYADDIFTQMATSHGSAKGTGAAQKSEK